jgi:transcriptional regulator with XRE-family HTH domain
MNNTHEIIETIRANILKSLNVDLKKSASQVAKALSISKTYAWDIMKGENFNPSVTKLIDIANKLNINFLDLMKD